MIQCMRGKQGDGNYGLQSKEHCNKRGDLQHFSWEGWICTAVSNVLTLIMRNMYEERRWCIKRNMESHNTLYSSPWETLVPWPTWYLNHKGVHVRYASTLYSTVLNICWVPCGRADLKSIWSTTAMGSCSFCHYLPSSGLPGLHHHIWLPFLNR